MEKPSLANNNSEPDKNGLIVSRGGRRIYRGGPGAIFPASEGSRASARLIRSPCRSGTSACRALRACVWI